MPPPVPPAVVPPPVPPAVVPEPPLALAPPVLGPLAPELAAPPEDVLGADEALEELLAVVEELVVVVFAGVLEAAGERLAEAPPGTVSDPAGVVLAEVEPPPPQPPSAAARATHEAPRASRCRLVSIRVRVRGPLSGPAAPCACRSGCSR